MKPVNCKEKYQQFLLEMTPRILSHLDRDITSPTYGCFDRPYWLYHLTDFPSAVLQQGCLTLTLLYANNFPGNAYYQNQTVREWARAAVSYWKKIQNKDGSFNEYWEKEKSLPATVFSTFAVSETARLLKIADNELKQRLVAACLFMEKNPEFFASNQEAAAIAAIFSVHQLTKEERLKPLFFKKLTHLKKLQSPEGFFYEQRGADAGYLTVSLNYLGWLFKELPQNDLAKDETKKMCGKALHFLSYMIHPDGSLGGEYGSRNTEYLLPGGLAILADYFPLAAAILRQHEKYLFAEPKNFSIDDRYLLHYFGPSFSLAAINLSEEKKRSSLKLPFQEKFSKYFADAGLFVVSRPNLYLLINLKKGGVFKLYSHRKCLANDLGYRIKNRSGKIYFSEFGNEKVKFSLREEPFSLEISKIFSPKKYLLMTPAKRFILPIFSSLFGKFFRKLVKESALKKSSSSPYILNRSFSLEQNKLLVRDKVISKIKNAKRRALWRISSQSVKLIPSSKFFQAGELANQILTKRIFPQTEEIVTEIDLGKNKVTVK